MVLALSAADILVHCALADNLPNVIMEAFACGTPALGFRVGGVPEMIREGETGWLAPAGSPEALSRALADALKDLQRDSARFSVACRRTAEKEYSLDRQAAAYEALFESLLK
jgi:glycosyltransferase involved in cell wall biosynthesis